MRCACAGRNGARATRTNCVRQVIAMSMTPNIRKFLLTSHRTSIAAIVAVGLLFAQIVTAAHACSTFAMPPAQEQSAMPADCVQSSERIDSTVNVCASHCERGAQVDSHADVPAPLIAPQLALVIRVTDAFAPIAGDASSSPAQRAPPTPLALSSRLLI